MSIATYSVQHMDYKAKTKSSMDNILMLDYTLALNDNGVAVVELPTTYNFNKLAAYDRLRIKRNGVIEGNTDFFVLRYGYKENADGSRSISITAHSALWLIKGPIARYYDGHAKSYETGYPDDVIKQIVRENGGASTDDSGRAVPLGLFTVASDTSQVTDNGEITVYYAEQSVYDTIAAIATDNDFYFDVVLGTSRELIFRTYPIYRGSDKSGRVKFSKDLGNLIAPLEVYYDYTEEVTQTYSGGPGEGVDKTVKTATNTARHDHPFARLRESYADFSDVTDMDALQNEADKMLSDGAAKVKVNGIVIDTTQAEYGKHWFLGDRVRVDHRGLVLRPIVNSIHVQYNEHMETVTATIVGDA